MKFIDKWAEKGKDKNGLTLSSDSILPSHCMYNGEEYHVGRHSDNTVEIYKDISKIQTVPLSEIRILIYENN